MCFHALGIIDQNREYLQMHLLASADLPTRQALSDIQIESARLDRTVRNAITLYQLENEELSELQPLDLCSLLEKAGRLAPDIQRSLEITLTTESGGIEHCAVMGVPDEAEQLLLHLISNALRACDAGGRVWVSLKQKKTGVALRVEDNGCGLMEEDPIENNRRFLSGAKLGLRICKLICRRAGWKLTLTARPGGGTRAQVVFLLASAAVLALQQLTQAADNAPRYQLLARLGAPERMRARSVDIQVFLSFFLPLALALVHAAVGMTAANAVIAEVGKVDAAASSAVAAVLLLVIYGGYFLATCWGSRRIVRGG